MKFHIGDKVKLGSTRIGTITDVGAVLIQVKTSEGSSRVVCPWEVVRILADATAPIERRKDERPWRPGDPGG